MNSGGVVSVETVRVGAQLRRLRFDRGLSLEVVAGLAGFSAGFLSRVERDQVVLDRLSHWNGLAAALRVPLLDLLRLSIPALNEALGGRGDRRVSSRSGSGRELFSLLVLRRVRASEIAAVGGDYVGLAGRPVQGDLTRELERLREAGYVFCGSADPGGHRPVGLTAVGMAVLAEWEEGDGGGWSGCTGR